MATRFVQQATNQLAPAYNQQITALQSQIPAIQQLYQALIQGLQGQQQVGNQNILEDASARGVLNSTMPVNSQAQLGQQILQQQGQYGLQQGQQMGDIYSKIAGVGVDRANNIANLATGFEGNYLQQVQMNNQQSQADRAYQLQQQTADQQYQLGLRAARKGY